MWSTNYRSFEFPDINRQTTWLTVYDGRGVFAKRIILNIQVKDHNVLWIVEHVDCYYEYHDLIYRLPHNFPFRNQTSGHYRNRIELAFRKCI